MLIKWGGRSPYALVDNLNNAPRVAQNLRFFAYGGGLRPARTRLIFLIGLVDLLNLRDLL